MELEDELEVIGTACDSASAVSQTRTANPDLILMDLKMPGKTGIQATQEIRAFNRTVKILVYTGYPAAAEPALAAGAQGIVLKGSSAAQLTEAIKSVLHGGVYFDQETWSFLKWHLWPESSKSAFVLNDEERALAPCLMEGLTSKEIADKLQKKERRVEKVRANMMKKLGVKNAAALAAHLAHLALECLAYLPNLFFES